MTQYIDKSAVVAAIKKMKKQYVGHSNFTTVTCTCDIIISLINTLEVKEIGIDVGSPEGDLGCETVQVIDDGYVKEIKIQKGEEV